MVSVYFRPCKVSPACERRRRHTLLHAKLSLAAVHVQGQCFTATAEKYTYEVCPFGSAAQKEGSSSTRYGPPAAFACVTLLGLLQH